jgi:hypothetical protein
MTLVELFVQRKARLAAWIEAQEAVLVAKEVEHAAAIEVSSMEAQIAEVLPPNKAVIWDGRIYAVDDRGRITEREVEIL